MDYYSRKIVLRAQEVSNHPGIIRRLGVIALNTALEMDIYGNVNSSHALGTHIMKGLAELRGLGHLERARKIINTGVSSISAPVYRNQYLRPYLP